MGIIREAKPTILIVDDATTNIELLSELLGDEYSLKIAKNGQKALEIANSNNKPDLILLDLMLPEVDGFGVLEAMRKNSDPKVAATPVIVLSNLWSNKDILRTKALQVQAYMVKAYFTTEEILHKINDILSPKPA